MSADEDREVRPQPRKSLYASNKIQRLKSALWFAVGQIVDEEMLRRNRNATPQFIGALTEMVWTQIGTTPPLDMASITCHILLYSHPTL